MRGIPPREAHAMGRHHSLTLKKQILLPPSLSLSLALLSGASIGAPLSGPEVCCLPKHICVPGRAGARMCAGAGLTYKSSMAGGCETEDDAILASEEAALRRALLSGVSKRKLKTAWF